MHINFISKGIFLTKDIFFATDLFVQNWFDDKNSYLMFIFGHLN
jgi:hypothetical protein